MIPGIPGGRVNPRQAKMLMKQLGYKELEDVEEVVIRMADRELVIRSPSVAEMNVQGQQMFQVVGQLRRSLGRAAVRPFRRRMWR